jgi:hypothetical protein
MVVLVGEARRVVCGECARRGDPAAGQHEYRRTAHYGDTAKTLTRHCGRPACHTHLKLL